MISYLFYQAYIKITMHVVCQPQSLVSCCEVALWQHSYSIEKRIGEKVNIKTHDDPRLIGVNINLISTDLFVLCVYVPVCNIDNHEEIVDYLGKKSLNC